MMQDSTPRSSRVNNIIVLFGLMTVVAGAGLLLAGLLKWPGWAIAIVVAALAEAGLALVMALILRGLMREDRKFGLVLPIDS